MSGDRLSLLRNALQENLRRETSRTTQLSVPHRPLQRNCMILLTSKEVAATHSIDSDVALTISTNATMFTETVLPPSRVKDRLGK